MLKNGKEKDDSHFMPAKQQAGLKNLAAQGQPIEASCKCPRIAQCTLAKATIGTFWDESLKEGMVKKTLHGIK